MASPCFPDPAVRQALARAHGVVRVQALPPLRRRYRGVDGLRDVALYIAVTAGNVPVAALSRVAAIPRRTIQHALARVEDARDVAGVDAVISDLEVRFHEEGAHA